MRITLVALGTRGDVQPVLALGQGLQAAGDSIHIIAGRNFDSWVRAFGFGFTGAVDMETLMSSEKGVAWAERSDSPRKQLQHMKELLAEYRDEVIGPLVEGSRDANLLISGFVSNPFVQAVSEKFGIPHISAQLQPYLPTRSGAASLAPIIKWGDSLLNLWMGYFAERLMWTVHADTTNHLRAAPLLPPAPCAASPPSSALAAMSSLPRRIGVSISM
jgi:UDP:flavonoid glycosyltransferase YjiC (YdhE family)